MHHFGTTGASRYSAFRDLRFRPIARTLEPVQPPKVVNLGPEIIRAAEAISEKRGMTVKTTNRSHRVIYMVVLLVFAVALTTALVLAAERSLEGAKSSSLQSSAVPALGAVCLWGNHVV